MERIPQRELRNNSAAVLRAAEAGARYVITVDGRPVAMLGPYRKRQWVPAEGVREILATPTDESVLDDLAVLDEEPVEDPWQE